MKALIEKLRQTNGNVTVNEGVLTFEDGFTADMNARQERSLHEFLPGVRVCMLSDHEKKLFVGNTGRGEEEADLCRVTLTNGRVVLAEGNFSEPVKGFLHFWTPLEDETFMMVPHSAIVSIAYSE